MIGVQAEFEGLRVKPVLPEEWNEVTIKRIFRGAIYNITIRRVGKQELWIDGMRCEEDVIPVFRDEKTHVVVVNI